MKTIATKSCISDSDYEEDEDSGLPVGKNANEGAGCFHPQIIKSEAELYDRNFAGAYDEG